MARYDMDPPASRYNELDIGSGRQLDQVPRGEAIGVKLSPGKTMVLVDNRVVLASGLDEGNVPRLVIARPTLMPVIKQKRNEPAAVCNPYPPDELEKRIGELGILKIGFGPVIESVYIGDRYRLGRVHSLDHVIFNLSSAEELMIERHPHGDPLELLEEVLDDDKY